MPRRHHPNEGMAGQHPPEADRPLAVGVGHDPGVADAFARIPRERLAAIAEEGPHTHPVAVAG